MTHFKMNRVTTIVLLVTFVLLTCFKLTQSAWIYSCINATDIYNCSSQNVRPTFSNDQPYAYIKRQDLYTTNLTGWEMFEIVTNGNIENNLQAYYAGVLEAYHTIFHILANNENLGVRYYCTQQRDGISEVLKNTAQRVEDNPNDVYWQEVGHTMYQVSGMHHGYHMTINLDFWSWNVKLTNVTPAISLEPCSSFLWNIYYEIFDLRNILDIRERIKEEDDDHCSALIKVIDGGRDVIVAHNTWNTYNSMLRIMKKYTFNFSTSKAKSIAFPSYPGFVFSADDFYITSTGLVIQETTLNNYNLELYRNSYLTQFVFEFIRNTVANRLATNGSEWARWFKRYSSGTYNNQFMIVDYKKLKRNDPSPKLEDGFLYIVEELPGVYIHKDKTAHLRNHTYWASYNIPFFRETYEKGNSSAKAKKDDFYSRDNCPRAKMFRRDHSKVTNLTSMYRLMRYNDFQNDPLSRCNICTPPYDATYAIASRRDLNDPNGTYPHSGYHGHGNTDVKVTNYELARRLEMIAVSGPTNDQQPTFNWTNTNFTDLQARHEMQPEYFDFAPVITRWNDSFDEFPFYNFDF